MEPSPSYSPLQAFLLNHMLISFQVVIPVFLGEFYTLNILHIKKKAHFLAPTLMDLGILRHSIETSGTESLWEGQAHQYNFSNIGKG